MAYTMHGEVMAKPDSGVSRRGFFGRLFGGALAAVGLAKAANVVQPGRGWTYAVSPPVVTSRITIPPHPGYSIAVMPSEYQPGKWMARLTLRHHDPRVPRCSVALTDGYDTPQQAIDRLIAFERDHEPWVLA